MQPIFKGLSTWPMYYLSCRTNFRQNPHKDTVAIFFNFEVKISFYKYLEFQHLIFYDSSNKWNHFFLTAEKRQEVPLGKCFSLKWLANSKNDSLMENFESPCPIILSCSVGKNGRNFSPIPFLSRSQFYDLRIDPRMHLYGDILTLRLMRSHLNASQVAVVYFGLR